MENNVFCFFPVSGSIRSHGNKSLKHSCKMIQWRTKEFWMCLFVFPMQNDKKLCLYYWWQQRFIVPLAPISYTSLQSVVKIHDEADGVHDCWLKFDRLSQYKAVHSRLWQWDRIIYLLWLDVCGNERPFIPSPRQSHQQLKWSITLGFKAPHKTSYVQIQRKHNKDWTSVLI